jgi:hypothetical protein
MGMSGTDKDGNTIVVWFELNGSLENIWYNRYDAESSSWMGASLLETDDSWNARDPEIGMDEAGNAIVVWTQNRNIMSKRYDASSKTWGTETPLETDVYSSSFQNISVNKNGDAMVVWLFYESSVPDIYAARYSAASDSWSTPQKIAHAESRSSIFPIVSLNDNGNAVAAWYYFGDELPATAYAAYYDAAANSWNAPVLIQEDTTQDAFPKYLKLNHQGNVWAFWHSGSSVWSREMDMSTGLWVEPQLVSSSCSVSFSYDVAFDSNDNGLFLCASWIDFDFKMTSVFYDANSNTWGAPKVIKPQVLGSAGYPSIVFDENDNGIAAWIEQDQSRYQLWVSRYLGQ